MNDDGPAGATTPLTQGSVPAARVMRIAPMDLRQPRFRTAMRGFDKTEVVAFLTEAAEDYESALRELDRLRHDLTRSEALLAEHRELEGTLRNTLVTAQKLADDFKAAAQHEAQLVIREAEGRADVLVQKAEEQVGEMTRRLTELQLRRIDAEGALESTIQTLHRALEFIRAQHTADAASRTAG